MQWREGGDRGEDRGEERQNELPEARDGGQQREERVRVCIQIGNSFAIRRPSHTSRGLGETWRRER